MTRRALIGFLTGLLIFIAINLVSAHLASDCGLQAVFGRDSCADDIARAGWPMVFYEEGGIAYYFEFSLPVLLLDLAIGIIWASVLGWFMARRAK
jgi:ABC-type antimicrobial peptide transport system permease subunit